MGQMREADLVDLNSERWHEVSFQTRGCNDEVERYQQQWVLVLRKEFLQPGPVLLLGVRQ